jgi:hypothetical protein
MRSTSRRTIQWIFFFCFLFTTRCSADSSSPGTSSSSSSSSSRSQARPVRSRRSRWERMDAPVSSNMLSKDSGGGAFASASSQRGTGTLQSSISSMSAMAGPGRRACGLYVWDAPSALLHKWCTHLMKDCIYEGRGGHKVRISLIDTELS